MRYIGLAFKRTVRSVYFPILLIIFGVAVFFAPFLGQSESLPTAGLVDLDGGDAADRIVSMLVGNGFELCENEEELRSNIEEGIYDCGAVIPEGIDGMLRSGKLDGVILFMETPTSFAADLYRNHVVSAVYTEYAPYMAASFLTDTVITADEMAETFHEKLSEGLLFTFAIESADGGDTLPDNRDETYTLTFATLFVFAMMMYTACDILRGDVAPLCERIGAKRTLFCAVLPTLAVRAILVIVAYAAAAAALKYVADDGLLWELFVPVAVYTVLISSFAVASAALMRNAGRIQMLSVYIIIATLVLCPVYFDVTSFLPAAEAVRCITPTWWLWMASESVTAPAVAAAAALPTSLALLYVTMRRGKRLKSQHNR